jgi:tetratricopeptide (TPR) repeat protein
LKKAQTLFSQALQIDPDYLLAVVGKGQAFNLQGKLDSGLVYADRAIDLDPEFNRSYGMKGYSCLGKGDADLALKYFFKAISLPPQDDWWLAYHVAIGQVYSRRKNGVIKALPYLRKGIEKKESQYVSTGYRVLCQAYLDIGDYQTASQYLAKNPDLERSCLDIILSYQLMTIQGNFKAALESTDSLCQLAECQASCASAMFEASVLLGEFKEAEQYFFQLQDVVAKLDPSLYKNILTIYLTEAGNIYLGYVYKQLGRTEEAEKVFAEQIKMLQSSENRNGYYDLAKIYAFQGNKKLALKYLAEYAKRGFTRGLHDFILIDPFFESLRDDPDFQAIAKQAQEEKAAMRAQVRDMEKRGELDL